MSRSLNELVPLHLKEVPYDAWGQRMRVVVEGPACVLLSAGPDGKFGSRDYSHGGRSMGRWCRLGPCRGNIDRKGSGWDGGRSVAAYCWRKKGVIDRDIRIAGRAQAVTGNGWRFLHIRVVRSCQRAILDSGDGTEISCCKCAKRCRRILGADDGPKLGVGRFRRSGRYESVRSIY